MGRGGGMGGGGYTAAFDKIPPFFENHIELVTLKIQNELK